MNKIWPKLYKNWKVWFFADKRFESPKIGFSIWYLIKKTFQNFRVFIFASWQYWVHWVVFLMFSGIWGILFNKYRKGYSFRTSQKMLCTVLKYFLHHNILKRRKFWGYYYYLEVFEFWTADWPIIFFRFWKCRNFFFINFHQDQAGSAVFLGREELIPSCTGWCQ